MKPLKTIASVCWTLALFSDITSARAAEKIAVFQANSRVRMMQKSVVPKPKPVAYQVYNSYFESNSSGLKGDSSFLLLPNQQAFDRVFGAAALGTQNSFLPRDAFKSKVVVAVIKRGASITNYSVQSVDTNGGTLFIRYQATASGSGSATFSSPLILSVPKAPYRSVVFIENGKRLGAVSPRLAAKTPQIKVYLVAIGDAGKLGRKFGCDDSLVAVTRPLTSARSPLKSALKSLLSMPPRDAQNRGLENFWKGRNLRLQSVSLRNGVATIRISGEVFVAGVCDQPRITEQIEATARQFATVKQVKVFIGRESLSRAIS